MNCLFLYHPTSGRGKIVRKLGYIKKMLLTRYDSVDLVATESGEDMTRHARAAAGKYDAILFSGGDGTFNRVLQGVEDEDVHLGYLPGGTTNDVARSLGIPRSVKGALKVILAGHEAPLDVMRTGENTFAVYIAAAGAFTRAAYSAKVSSKKRFGMLAYAFEVLRHELRLRVFPLEIEGGGEKVKTHAVLILIMNGRSVAGMPVNRRGSMRDGQLEIAVIRQKERPGLFAKAGAFLSIAAFFLFHGAVRKKHIMLLRGSRFTVRTQGDVSWSFDGEKGTDGDLVIEAERGRMKLFVPRQKKL